MKKLLGLSAFILCLAASMVHAQTGPYQSGYIYTVAGNGTFGYAGDGGPAIDAEMDEAFGVGLDAAGNFYIADTDNNVIRKVNVAAGVITTVAGTGEFGFSGDGGPATSAQLQSPFGVVVDAAGSLYIADWGNSRVRKVDATTGIITTIAGSGSPGSFSGNGSGGPALDASIGPIAIALDSSVNIYLADLGNDCIWKIDAATGIINQIVGDGVLGFAGDGGPASSANLNAPLGVGLDQLGNIYIADTKNERIRKVDAATGIITTVAGDGTAGYAGDSGLATAAELNGPQGVALDPDGNLYIAEFNNCVVRKVDASTGLIDTYAGQGTCGFSGDGGPATLAQLGSTPAVALDTHENLYIADGGKRIRVVGALNTNLIATTTTLTVSTTALTAGESLTLTATVTAASGATPTGPVTFYNGTASLGTGSLNAGRVATLTVTPAIGSYSITASYGGSTTDASSASSPPIAVTVSSISTTTGLVAAPTALTAGQTLTITATVDAASGATPTGTVTFLNGAASLGAGSVNANGVADLTLTPAIGTYSITASYGGSSTDAPSASPPPITVTVSASATTTTLTASASSLTYGQQLTLTATVTAASGPTPSGSVNFLNGTTSVGTGSVNSAGVATLTLNLAVGAYSITASYGGSSTDSASVSSPPVAVTVTAAATTTTVTSSLNPAPFAAAVMFTATVGDSATPAGPPPTGTVSFFDGTTLLGTATLASGVGTYTISTLSAGAHNITATYAATTDFSASMSSVLIQVITAATFNISAAPPSQSVYTGLAASYTVTIAPGTGFNLPVALTCSQLPANTTCSFSPATVNGGSWSSTLLVQTAAPSPSTTASFPAGKAGAIGLAGLLLFLIPRRWHGFRKGSTMFFVILASLAVASAITACGGPIVLTGGTPVGSQTITLNGSATNGSQTLTESTTITLQVQSLF